MATKKSTKKSSKRTKSAFMKPLQPDSVLAKVVGEKPLPRTEITKRLWSYIKKNKCQNQSDKRKIDADEVLLPIFNGKKQVNMFEMTKLVAQHVR